MHVVLVSINVKSERIDDFIQATLENAKNSIHEPGIARFDFLRQGEDPTKFMLVEVYRTPDDQLKHRETAHYLTWKDKVADMLAEPRVGVKYQNLYPDDVSWG